MSVRSSGFLFIIVSEEGRGSEGRAGRLSSMSLPDALQHNPSFENGE